DETHKLWYWIEDHGEIVFPIVGLAIVALIVFGIRRGMTSNIAELQKKQDQKDAIVRMMRAKLLVSADAVAGDLHIDRFMAAAPPGAPGAWPVTVPRKTTAPRRACVASSTTAALSYPPLNRLARGSANEGASSGMSRTGLSVRRIPACSKPMPASRRRMVTV